MQHIKITHTKLRGFFLSSCNIRVPSCETDLFSESLVFLSWWLEKIFQNSIIPYSPPQSFNALSLSLFNKTLSDAGRRKQISNSFIQQHF